MTAHPASTDKRDFRHAATDIAVVMGLSAVFVLTSVLEIPGLWVIPGVAIALLVFGLAVWRRGTEKWRDFGLRSDNLVRAFCPIIAWTALAAGAIIAYALIARRDLWKPELAVLLPLYPLYGIAQQFIFQGVLHRRLMTLLPNRWLPILLTAITSALLHMPFLDLVALTFVAGLAWSWLFQRYPNVWLLGLSHGILAALAYPLILGENPLHGM